MKERAGRERAVLGVVFNQGHFDAGLVSTFSRNLGEFSAYQENFRRAASDDFVRQLDERLQRPSAQEVARLQRLAFEVPLGFLLDPGNVHSLDVDFQGRRRQVLEFRYGGHRIWGATAAMLVNFRHRLEQVR